MFLNDRLSVRYQKLDSERVSPQMMAELQAVLIVTTLLNLLMLHQNH